MRIVRRTVFMLAFGHAFAAHADFSWELTGLLGQTERGDGLESDVASVGGTYYFEVVTDSNGPRALAAFLDPITNVFVAVREQEDTNAIGTGPSPVFERETTDSTIGGTYVFPRSKWYGGGRYSSGEIDDPPPPPPPATAVGDSDDTEYALVAGKYFGAGATRLELSVEQSKLETEQSTTVCPIPTVCVISNISAENTVDVERLDVKHVGRVRSATYAVFGGTSSGDVDIHARITITPPAGPPTSQTFDLDLYSFDTYGVGAELYPVPNVGVRLGYTRLAGPTVDDEDTVDVGVSWFFRRNVGFEVALSSVDSERLPRTERAALRVIGRLR